MSIKATCGGCGKTYALNEKYAGKRLPCKECGEKFHVPGGDDFDEFEDDFEPPPTRRRRPAAGSAGRGGPRRGSPAPARSARKRPKKKKRSSGPNWAVIGISAGAGVAAIALVVVLMMTVFGGSAESLTEDLLDAQEDMVDVMEGITDEASAKAAIPKIRRIGNGMVSTLRKIKEYDKSKPLTREEQKALQEKFQDRMRELRDRQSEERRRLRGIPGATEAIQEGMREPAEKMAEIMFESDNGKRPGGGSSFPF